MINKIKYYYNLYKSISRFSKLEIYLDNDITGKGLFNSFSKRHPKLFLIRRKTIGVAIINKNDFKSADEYLKSVNGKNSAAYYARKAKNSGNEFKEINPNEFADAIHEIHCSSGERQGKKIDVAYHKKFENYPINSNNIYYGVFNKEKLVAYLWIVKSGDLMLMNRIMGHSEFLGQGIMYLLVTEFLTNSFLFNEKYIMYDTILGGGEGLKLFKKRCGFNPYKVKWRLNK